MSWWKNDYEKPEDRGSEGGGSGGRSGGGVKLWRLRLPFGMENGRDILYLDDNPSTGGPTE